MFMTNDGPAVRLPEAMAYADMGIELKIIRMGDVITIYPARASLKNSVDALRAIPKPRTVERRRPVEVPMRKRD
jgi:antitoxin VapB